MSTFCRVLLNAIEVEYFVDGILKIKQTSDKRDAINKILEAERNMNGYEEVPTLTHKDNRDFEYREDNKRNELRQQILDELINLERLDNDDEIKLGIGGAKPRAPLLKEKKAFYIMGPPASGKSMIANKLADTFGAYILDSDYAKRKLPEYFNQIGGASLVHDESVALVFNYNHCSLQDICIKNSYNIIIPKIGHNMQKVLKYCSTLQKIGYSVYLISVALDREKATQRAYYRYKQSLRCVPLSLIFDGYSNESTLNYFKIKEYHSEIFSGFAQISTDVPLHSSPKLLSQINLEKLSSIFER